MNRPPEPPPEGVLIESARREARLSVREAARRAGISEGWWRQVVKGYQSLSGGAYGTVRDVPAETVAKMAKATGRVTPERMADEGRRQDAAEVMRRQPDAAAATDALAVLRQARSDDSVLGLAPRMTEAVEQPMADIAGLAETAAEIEEADVPSGASVFGPGPEAARWDKLVQLGWDMIPGKGFTLPQMVRAAAVARVRDDERREGYGHNEAAVRLIRT